MATGKVILIEGTLVTGVEDGATVSRPKYVRLPDTSDVATLRRKFSAAVGFDIHICYKGEMIERGSLEGADLLPTPDRRTPHVFLCRQKEIPKNEGGPKPPTTNTTTDTVPTVPDPVDPVCRLCFGDEETFETGKLFSPCLCKGTMKYIHVECLAKWRWRSQNSNSYYKCDQCQYEYNVTRASWAHHLLDERLTTAVAVFGLVLMTLSLGVLTESLSSDIATKTWDFLAFYPLKFISEKMCNSEDCNYVCNTWNFWSWEMNCYLAGCRCTINTTESVEYLTRVLSNGLVSAAVMGVYLRRERFNVVSFLVLLAYFFSNGNSGRLVVFFGIIHSYFYLHQSAHLRAKYFLTRFGERILNVTPTTS